MLQAPTSNSNSSDIDSDIGSNSGSESEQAQPLSFLSNMEVDRAIFNTDANGDLAGLSTPGDWTCTEIDPGLGICFKGLTGPLSLFNQVVIPVTLGILL
jgi:hypothetical protein